MDSQLTVVTTFFNPAKYLANLKNYFIFSNQLKRQNIRLITVELAFKDDDFCIPQTEDVHRLRGQHVLWMKERLINYAVDHLLPPDCKYYCWIDADILLPDGWDKIAIQKFESGADILQLFKKVVHLPRGHESNQGQHLIMLQSIVWQRVTHKNWLERRIRKELPFSVPGFAWGVKRELFDHVGGVYDRNIVGSGDTFFVDCLFDSWEIHGYASKFTDHMKKHMETWCNKFRQKEMNVDYLPIDIDHLWHGSLKNRGYMTRHDAIIKGNYDPEGDLKLASEVYEWNSDKPQMHLEVEQYFFMRKEDNV